MVSLTSSTSNRHDTAVVHRQTASTTTMLFADDTGSSSSSKNGIQIVDLSSIDDDHEKEGQKMADSIVAWLDDEWIPQQVHVDMAESAKKSYIRCRESGSDDVMDVMMSISNDLETNWNKYNDDAFVNAWDIGNYCSDYLVKRSGNEGCECTSEIF